MCAVLFALLLPIQGCTALADWQKVQSKIPALEDAFQLIVAATDPHGLAVVQSIQNQINAQLSIIASVLQQYQANISSAAPGDVDKINAAVAAVTTLLPRILPTVHATDQDTADLISAFVDAIEGVFFPELASLLPSNGSSPGAMNFMPAHKKIKVKIITVEQMIKRFNSRQHKKVLKKPSILHQLGNAIGEDLDRR